MSEQLVFEDVTDQWEIDDRFMHRGWTIFVYCDTVCIRDKDGDIDSFCRIHENEIRSQHSTVLATRKPKKPPEPKYVPFANAEEARSVVGWEPWWKNKKGFMEKLWQWPDGDLILSRTPGWCLENLVWSNTPDDPSSWKPFGKLVTE